MGEPYEIRWARKSEWSQAMKMIWRTYLIYDSEDYTKEGDKNFFSFITDADLHAAFLRGEYLLMVALDGERIIGAGSLRGRNRLSLLFVEDGYHRQGVGSAILGQLCNYLQREAGEKYISVMAAPGAVEFYKKEGFRVVRPEAEIAGIRVTTMEKEFRE